MINLNDDFYKKKYLKYKSKYITMKNQYGGTITQIDTTLEVNGETIGAMYKLPYHSNIIELTFDNNTIDNHGATNIAEFIKKLTNLEIFTFKYNTNTDKVIQIIAGSLVFLNKLRELTLDSNLTQLTLANNDLGSGDATALAYSFKKMHHLTYLNISYKNFGSRGAIALASGFKFMPKLKHLYLRTNNIDNIGAITLARSFQNISNLIHLDLYDNNIGNAGAIAIAESFKYITLLEYLCLSYNNIGNKGAIALADSFQYIKHVKFIYLPNNKISDEGAIKLVYSFPSNNDKLNYIILSYNYISDECKHTLTRIVADKHHSLLELSFISQKKQEKTFVCLSESDGMYDTKEACESSEVVISNP